MAEEINQEVEDKTVEKAIWHYVGVTVLWTSLFLTGMAFERLGLTSSLFSGIFPGEVGSLRTQATECDTNLGKVKLERDLLKRQEDTLRMQIKQMQGQAAAQPK